MSTSSVLAILGTLLGLYYGYLGIVAGGHFVDQAKCGTFAERVFLNPGWSIGPGDEYTEEGKRFCRRGNIVLVTGMLCWFGWGLLK